MELQFFEMKPIFWFSLLFIFYTYLGYPILLFIVTKLRSKPINESRFTPYVTMIIAVYNENQTIRSKLENILSMDYPKDKFDIIVVSDGSSDGTDDTVRELIHLRNAETEIQRSNEKSHFIYSPRASAIKDYSAIKIIRMPERGGKARALNTAVPEAKGEIIVFADARQLYDKKAINELIDDLSDPTVGAVSGELYLINQDSGEGMGIYWWYEKLLRKMESCLYSTLGTTGAIYAIRKELYRPIPNDTILDDFVIPMNVVLSGYRVIFEENARAYDSADRAVKKELTRKIRTLCGNYQAFLRLRVLFNPFKNKIFLQFISHKVFRLLVPFALIFMLISSLFLFQIMFYRIMLILQICLYVSAFVGHYLSKTKPSFISRLFGIPYTFVVLNYAAVAGLYRFITHKQKSTWEKAK